MRMIGWKSHMIGLLSVMAMVPSMARDVEGSQQKDESKSVAWPTLPKVQLRFAKPYDDEASYVATISTQIQALEQQTAKANENSQQQRVVDLQLALANQLLAYQADPSITRELLGLPRDERVAGEPSAEVIKARTGELLESCQATIDQFSQGELDDAQKVWLRQTKRRLRSLRGFSAGVQALLVAEPDQTALRQAASLLAVLREDSDGAVMAASGLWQAVVRSKMDDVPRALDMLPLALADLRQGSLVDSFFARLLRCQLLAEQGRYATSLALLTNIEERCDDWFESEPDRAAAQRTAAWLQLNVLHNWYQARRKPGREAEARWCVKRAGSIIAQRFSGDAVTLLRLSPAIPIVAHATAAKTQDPNPKP